MFDLTSRMHVPMLDPSDIIPHLASGDRYWRRGCSAHALATAWFMCNGLPGAVSALLNTSVRFRDAELIDAILERQTSLRDGVHGVSQTDLMALLGLKDGLAVVAVEGKVEESFGRPVEVWRDGSHAREKRYGKLVDLLGVNEALAAPLRYQLLHRAAAAVYEAQRYRTTTALLLVHSFSPRRTGWADFERFCAAIGLSPLPKPGLVLGPARIRGIDFYGAWLTDELPETPFA